jgi:hypothetical protein
VLLHNDAYFLSRRFQLIMMLDTIELIRST